MLNQFMVFERLFDFGLDVGIYTDLHGLHFCPKRPPERKYYSELSAFGLAFICLIFASVAAFIPEILTAMDFS